MALLLRHCLEATTLPTTEAANSIAQRGTSAVPSTCPEHRRQVSQYLAWR